MEFEAIIVWSVLLIVVILFVIDRIPADAVALAGLLVLTVVGSLGTQEALAGFSSTAVIVVASLLVLGSALERSGVVDRVVDGLYRLAGNSERRLLLAGTLAPGLLSGVINVIAAVTVFIPVMLRLALKAKRSPTRLLLPMSYVAMAGANLTLIGASANLVINDILAARTDTGFGLLEFAPLGIIMVLVTTVYVISTAHWLLPEREMLAKDGPEEQTKALIDRYGLLERLWELSVIEGAQVAGKEIGELRLAKDHGLTLVSLDRADKSRPHLHESSSLMEGDILLVGGRRERVEAMVEAIDGLELSGSPAHRDEFSAGSAELIEIMVPPRSAAIGRTVSELDLRGKADLTAIALWRDDKPLRTDVEITTLKAGDAILLYGNKRYTRGFEPEAEFRWLHEPKKESEPERARRLAPWTLAIFMSVIVVAAMGWLPIVVATVTGALAVTLLGALNARQAYAVIDWRTLVLIAAMLPYATALNNSGAASDLAAWLVGILGQWGLLAVMGAIALLALILTQAMHNVMAAAVMTPVALDAAQQLGANPKAFALAVLVAVSMSVMLPTGHPAPLLVRRPGNYLTVDYLRFGGGLVALTLLVILLVIPRFWPLMGA
jgi:di/tricarboxylate transporter